MKRNRKPTRRVMVRGLPIGGGAPVSIQSMTSLPIEEEESTIRQIEALRSAGADLVRLALRNEESIAHLKRIRGAVDMPLSADVHFNHRIALLAIEAGIDKIRINPGNIGGPAKVREVVHAARERGVPIRVGVNGGSLDRDLYPDATPENMVSSALDHVRILEENGFTDIVVSIKSSDLHQTIEANRLFSSVRDYPLHVGLTEAGYGVACVVRSSIAIGHLLMEGIGDTIRVSMTGDPVEEVTVAERILESVGERIPVLRIISCPTCGRTDPSLDVLALAREVEGTLAARFSETLKGMGRSLTVAVMGCEVNGPGEACHADVGVAGGRGGALLLFAGGKKLKKISLGDTVKALEEEIAKIIDAWRSHG